MYKAFIVFFFLVLFSCSSAEAICQVARNESRPANETITQAERLLHEGIELTEARQFALAVRAFQEAIKLNPEYADAYAALGRAYFKMREWRRAVDNLHRAAALNAKLRQEKNASQQQSTALKPVTTPAEKVTVVTASVTPLKQIEVKLQPVEPQVSKPAAVEPTGPTAERSLTLQPPPSGASTQPQKVADSNATKVADAKTTETPTLSSATPNAVEVAQRSSPEVTQAEKTAAEVSPSKSDVASAPKNDVTSTPKSDAASTPTNDVTSAPKSDAASTPKSDAASTPEEKPEPTGANVSMISSPTSSTIESAAASPIPLNPSNEDISLTKIYRIGPGDVLDVRINDAQPQQSTLFTVTPAGLLEHPLLAEPLNVSALTTEEIQTKIQDDLKKRALSENPDVTVGVRDYASHTILVSGLVKDSGTKFLRREAIPLYVVVADAQPLPQATKVTVVRNEQNQMFEIDLTNVAHMNLLVRPGDVINLQPNETQFIYVGGEVKTPGEKIFRRGLTLTQAIISAGGMTSKSKVAEIGRDDGQGFLVKTTFNLKDIQTGKVMDPSLRAGDRIMILR